MPSTRELARLCAGGITPRDLFAGMRSLMPIDAAFFSTVDPATLLFTAATTEYPLVDVRTAFLDNEFGDADVNKFSVLAHSRDAVETLDAATRGDRHASARYREILAPLGLGDELRVALRTGSATWGVMCLHREDGSTGFTSDETAIVRHLAPFIAEGIRRAALLVAATGARADDDAPGVVVLEPDLSIVSETPSAASLLDELVDADAPVAAVVASLHARGGPTRLSVRSARGRYLTLHASLMEDHNERIALVIEPTRATDVIPVVLLAHGLTPREAEIAQLVVKGYSTSQIVNTLRISRHTVQDHLKLVFDKIGVRSRRELVGQLLMTSTT